MSNLPDSTELGEKPSPGESRLARWLARSQNEFEIEFYQGILNRDSLYSDVLVQLGRLYTEKGWHHKALCIDRRLAILRPNDPHVAYNLACSHALLGQTSNAVMTLRRAVGSGYWDVEHLLSDPDLDSLRDDPGYLAFIRELQLPLTDV